MLPSLGNIVFRSRVKLYNDTSPLTRRNVILSTLTKGGHPVSITNYATHEQIVIDLPLSVIEHDATGHAAIAENGMDTIVLVGGMPIVILRDFVDLEELDLRFIAKSYAEDAALYDGPRQDAAADATVIEDSDRLIVVSEFDVRTDKLEIGEGRTFHLEDSQDGSGTVVVVDGQPIFLVQGILPAQMAGAVV